jgi:hypothetical protein
MEWGEKKRHVNDTGASHLPCTRAVGPLVARWPHASRCTFAARLAAQLLSSGAIQHSSVLI